MCKLPKLNRRLAVALAVLGALTSHLLAQTSERDQDALATKSRVAKEALLNRRYTEAVSLYRDLLKSLPDNGGLRLNLAIALEKSGQPSAAIPELERVTRANPSSSAGWVLLGLAYQQLNQPKNAIAPLLEAVRLDSRNTDALLELADAELTSGNPRDAAKDFGALAAMKPDFLKAWEGLGRAYLSLSESAFQQLQKQVPQAAHSLALSARSRASEEKFSEALSMYAKAAELEPGLPGVHAALAEIYRQTGRTDLAAVEMERESHVPMPDCSRRAAACSYLKGAWQRAVAESAQPRSPENLYWTALASSRLAEDSFHKLESFPQSPEMHAVLADSYQRMGRRLDAVAE
jgi:predicted Zn-dependent protease